jgi:hypothetical protein
MFIIALFSLLFASCKDDSGVTVVTPSFKGAFVLYESVQAGGSDYCFIDVNKDTVINNLFQNANSGIALTYSPGGIRIVNNQNFYIVCGGLLNQNGKIYEINSSNNQVINSQPFGTNPRCFDINLSQIYV